MKSNAKRSKKTDIILEHEPMARMKSKLVKKEKPRAVEMDAEFAEPERKKGVWSKKKDLKGKKRMSWFCSSEWKSYGHFF